MRLATSNPPLIGFNAQKSLLCELDPGVGFVMLVNLQFHFMPGLVMRFIEHLEPVNPGTKNIGFILQCGFSEGFQCSWLERYFQVLAQQLNMNYLGTFIKPESAGVYASPKLMTRSLFKNLQKFGEIYEETHQFDQTIIQKMKQPWEITGFGLTMMKTVQRLGVIDMFWNKMIKKHNAFEKRFDRPFSSQ